MSNYEAAEYDEAFLERMWEMGYEGYQAYLQSLSEAERRAVEEAFNRAASLRALKEFREYLDGVSQARTDDKGAYAIGSHAVAWDPCFELGW